MRRPITIRPSSVSSEFAGAGNASRRQKVSLARWYDQSQVQLSFPPSDVRVRPRVTLFGDRPMTTLLILKAIDVLPPRLILKSSFGNAKVGWKGLGCTTYFAVLCNQRLHLGPFHGHIHLFDRTHQIIRRAWSLISKVEACSA